MFNIKIVKTFPGFDTIIFHVNIRINNAQPCIFYSWSDVPSTSKLSAIEKQSYLAKTMPEKTTTQEHMAIISTHIGELGVSLVNALKKIEGVEIIEIHSYYVSIDKGLAFDWWRIEEEIEQTIRYVLSGTPNIETIKLLNGI